MDKVLFFDLEVDAKNGRIKDIGACYQEHTFHSGSLPDFNRFAQKLHSSAGTTSFGMTRRFSKKQASGRTFWPKAP